MAFAIVLIVIVAAIAALESAAIRWGVDSRPDVGDDHRRTTRTEGI